MPTDFSRTAAARLRTDWWLLATFVSLLLGLAAVGRADDAAWTGADDAAWSTTTNWSVAPVPGPADTATFAGGGNGNIVVSLGAGVTVGDILFDTASAAGYTIGSGAVGSQTLTLAEGGGVTMNATVDANQVFNAAILLGGDAAAGSWSFDNESTAGTLFLAGTVSGGSGGTAGTKSLTIDGAGNTVISGVVGNGGASAVSLTKTGTGTLLLTATNTFTGGTTIGGGILAFANNSLGTSGPITMDGGTLRWHVGNTQDVSARLALVAGKTATFDTNGNGVSFGTAFGGGTSGALTKVGAGTLTLTAANTYTGATSINAGGIALSGTAGSIAGSSGLAFNGGSLTLTNTTTAEGGVDRLGNAAGITSAGGTFTYTNTSGITAAETVGPLTLSSGQFNTVLTNNMATGSQTLTYGGLTRSGAGNTSVATFSSGTALNATTNMVKVTGAAATTAGQIIGPWATTGTAAANQTDYAVYDASGNVLPAAIANSAETTWTGGATGNYTATAAPTITATRTMNSFRYSAAAGSLTLNQFNFETNGLLNGGTGLLTVGATSGVLRQQGTAAAPLYVTTGNAGITINANIADNTGALTLVKSGTGGNLLLNGLNTYSGGTVVNAGNLYLGPTNSVFTTGIGGGTLTMNGGNVDAVVTAGNAGTTLFNLGNNALTINGDFSANANAASSLFFGTGAVSLGTVPALARQITVSNGFFTLGGVVANGAGASAIAKAGTGTLVLSGANTYTGGTTITAGSLQMGTNPVGSVGAVASSAIGTGPVTFNGNGVILASDSLAARTVLNPLVFAVTTAANNTSFGTFTNNALGQLTFAAPADLGQAAVAQTLTLNANAQFNATLAGVGSVVKTGIGTLVINSPAIYGGATSVAQGTLRLGAAGGLPVGTNVSIAGTQTNQTSVLDLNGRSATIGTLALSSAISVANTNTNPSATGSSLVTTGAGTLTLGGDLSYAATSNPFASTVAGNLSLGAASRNFSVTNSTNAQSFPDLIVSAGISGGAGVNLTVATTTATTAASVLFSGNNSYQGSTTLTGGGTLFITGNNTTTGATTLTSGTLVARSTGALGGSGNTAGVSVAASQNLTYNAVTDGVLTIGGDLAYAGAGTLGASIGANLDTGRISVLGNATTTANTITVNIFGNAASTTTGGGGTYTLLRGAGAGSSVGTATYTLGAIYNNTNFTVSSTLVKSATDLQATVTAATPLSTAYWKGTGSSNNTVWSASSNGAVASNWTSDLAGATVSAVVPGATTDVIFSATGATAPTTTTLGSDMTIKSLTQLSANAMTVNADGYTLTISPTDPTRGISLLPTSAVASTYNQALALGAPQAWTNFSGSTFTVNGNVGLGSNALVITGGSQTTVAGVIGGTGGITKNGTGTLVLQGLNTFTGGITVNQGTLQIDNPGALGTGTLTLNQSATLNSGFANLVNANNNPVAINGDFTFTGSQNLVLGSGNVSLGSANDPVPTITVTANTLTLNGVVANGTSGNGLAKNGTGTLFLGATNTYTGPTTLTQGTLRLGVTNAIASGNAFVSSPTNNAAPTLDLNGFNQTFGSLLITGAPASASQSATTISNTNVASPSTLTLTGGADAFSVYPVQGFNLNAPTISVNTLDLAGAAQTFYVGGNINGTTTINSVIQNGALTKAGPGTLALTNPNTYTGATSVFGGSLTLSGNLGALNSAAGGLVLNGGVLSITNVTNQNLVNRVADAAAITSHGGGVTFANTAGAGVVYAETLGSAELTWGQFDVVLSTNQGSGAGNAQTLTFGGLTRSGAGNTSAATFSSATALNATANMVKVTGATATAANQIIGPWATAGTAANAQTDYAVYDASGFVIPRANSTDQAETAWSLTTDAYNMSTAKTLTANRTITALRSSGAAIGLTLNQFNLETYGLLNGGTGLLTVSGTSGVLRQQGTAAAPVFVTTGNNAITISANIADNTGALTLVKSGTGGTLTLSGLNSYTGGTVINAGNLTLGATNSVFTTALGTGGVTMNGGIIDSGTANMFNLGNNALTINGDISTTSTQSLFFGTGAVSLGASPGFSRRIAVTNNFALAGTITNGTTVNSITKAGTGNLILSGANTYTGDTLIGNGYLQLGRANVGSVGAITSSPVGSGRIVFVNDGSTIGGIASDSIAAREILNPVVFRNNAQFGLVAATNAVTGMGKLTFSGPIDLGASVRTLTFASDVDFNGVVAGTGGVAGGGIVKSGPGTLTLNAAATYGGPTVVAQGNLRVGASGQLPYLTNVAVGGLSATQLAALDLNGTNASIGTLTMGGLVNNSYLATTINAGNNIVIGGANQTFSATGSSLVTTGSGTLTLGGDLTYLANTNALAARIGGKLDLGTLNLTSNGILGTAAGFARTISVADSTAAAPDLAVSSVISGGAGVGLLKTGAGMLLLSGNNTFPGESRSVPARCSLRARTQPPARPRSRAARSWPAARAPSAALATRRA